MSSDYWKEKAARDKRSEEFHRAVGKEDWDAAVHAAAPDKYPDYLEMKRTPSGADAGSTAKRPEAPQEWQDQVRQEQESLCDLIGCTNLDVLTRTKFISQVAAIERSDPNAFEKLKQLRNRISPYLPA